MKFLTAGKHHSKRELLFDFLDDGKTMVHIDSRREGVDVPPQHRGDPHLRLNFSYAFHLPHFEITEEAIEADLSFRGQRYFCIIPWHAVFAMTSHAVQIGYMWPDDLPPELASTGMGGAPAPTPKPNIQPVPGHPKLGVIRGGNAPEPPKPEPKPEPKPAPSPQADDRPALKPSLGPMPVAPSVAQRPNVGPSPVSMQDAPPNPTAPVGSTNASKDSDDDDDPTPPEGGRRYGHLRVVK